LLSSRITTTPKIGMTTRFDAVSVKAFISASRPGDAMPCRKGVAQVSSANTSWVRTPSATEPRTTRIATSAAKPTTTVSVARPLG